MHCHDCNCVSVQGLPLFCLLPACMPACLQALPLLGGRNVSAHAAAVLELLCTPPAPSATAAAAQAGGTGKDNGTKGGKSRAGSAASSKASAGGAGGTDRSLSSVLQQGVLAAGGLPALLKVGRDY
jgi:hypothetical protein